MTIPGPLERESTDEHCRDYPIAEFVGKHVQLCTTNGVVYRASLLRDDIVLESWEAPAPLTGKKRDKLELSQVAPLTATTIRIHHKPNEPPELLVGVCEYVQSQ